MRSCAWMLTIALLAALALPAQAAAGEESGDWTVPTCNRILGTRAVTYTTDEGLTLAKTRQLTGFVYTRGLAALDVGNTLLAASLASNANSILRSEDAGCNWEQVALIPTSSSLFLTAAPGGVAYGWSRGQGTFYRIEGYDFATLTAPQIILGFAVDPADADHIRFGTNGCQLYESFDGGQSFAPLGGPADTASTIFFSVEFDPADIDHALCGAKGAYRTTDAGQSWSAIESFDYEDIDLVYLFEFSPADPARVWARANLDTMGTPSHEILMSNDGGATFATAFVEGEPALDQFGGERPAMLSNQPTMAAHAEDPDVLYFTWVASECCPYKVLGENLGRYDAYLDQLSVVFVDGVGGIGAIEFNPASADVMYLGLDHE